MKKTVSLILALILSLSALVTLAPPAEAANKQPIPYGTYYISSAINSNMVIDVNNNGSSNGTKIQLWKSKNNLAQRFIMYYNNGYYTIIHLGSKKVLDVQNGKAANGTKVQLYKSNNSKAQKWSLVSAGNGYYYIKSALGNYYLDVAGGKDKKGTQIQIYSGNQSKAQKFRFHCADSYYTKTVTLKTPKTLQDWLNQMQKTELSLTSGGQYIPNGDGKTHRYTGPIIFKREVLATTKIWISDPKFVGPTIKGKYDGRKIAIQVPTKIRYTLHKHDVNVDCSERQLGAFLSGIANLEARCVFSCSCGLSYETAWKMPTSSDLAKAANGQTLTVTVRNSQACSPYAVISGK